MQKLTVVLAALGTIGTAGIAVVLLCVEIGRASCRERV